MKFIGVGGCRLGLGEKPKVGNTIHKEANSSAVSSVGHRNCHSQPGRTRWSSAAVAPHTPAVINRRGFKGRQKITRKSRPGHL